MKLIKEVVENVNYLVEEKDGKKSLYIEGPFLVAEAINRNGRKYLKETMEKEVNRYTQEYVTKNRAFGELGHPDTPNINLDRISHLTVGLRQEGTVWIGKAKILETPMGNIARNLIEGGGQLGVSSRGMGSLKNVNGVNVVQDDFRLATAADIVADPSAPGAFVQGIMEGKEWMLVDNVWTEMHYDQAKKQIQQASRKDIESVSLMIFENFLRKL
jgi:Prohead core protein serine protease